MIKVFTTNKNGKIELTKEELKNLLDEAYWDGYRANNHSWTYTTPNWTPYQWTATNDRTISTLSSTSTANTEVHGSTNDTSFANNVTIKTV